LLQRIFVVLFVIVLTVGTLVVGDKFPFSSVSRFRDPIDHYWQFQVFDPDGRQLPPADFGLHRNYAGLPVGLGSGRVPPESLNRLGAKSNEYPSQLSSEDVETWVQDRFAAAWKKQSNEDESWPFVTVDARLFRRVGQTVDVHEAFRVTIINPAGGL